MSHSVLAIANEFLRRARAGQPPRGLTNMQLQKLIYLAHGWNLAVTGEELISDRFEAWQFGPVVRKLYDAIKHYGDRPVSRYIRWGDDTPFPYDDEREEAFEDLLPVERDVIDRVWHEYSGFEAFQLSALTHADGTPWTRAYVRGENRPIANNSIHEEFVRLADAP